MTLVVDGFVYGKLFFGQNNVFQLRHIGQEPADPVFGLCFLQGMEDVPGVGQTLGHMGFDIVFKVQIFNAVFFIEQTVEADNQLNPFPVKVGCVLCSINDGLNVRI